MPCKFYAPIGVKSLRAAGDEFVGSWKDPDQVKDYSGEVGITLAQRFLNVAPGLAEIEGFTQRYGPLTGNPLDGQDGFSFLLDEWQGNQKSFRKLWRSVMRTGGAPYQPHEQVVVEFAGKKVRLRCPDLYTFMAFEVLSSGTRLRICERPDCTTSHFIPQHGKERYCSIVCSNWAQSKWKKQWHKRQRALPSAKSKEGSHGTKKTR